MKILLPLCAAASAIVLSSCAANHPLPPAPAPEKVAVVTFELSKSVRASDGKKGALENPVGQFQSDSSQFEDLQNALDTTWAKLSAGLPAVTGYQFIPTEDIAANAKYKELTKRDPLLIAGKDIFGSYLVPRGGLQQVDYQDTAKLHALSDALGVKKLVILTSTASYGGGFSIGGMGSANMILNFHLRIYEPGKGIYLENNYKGVSDDGVGLMANSIPHSAYPKLLPQTAKPILEQIAKDAGKGK